MIVRQSLLFILFLTLQAFIFNHVHLWGYGTPFLFLYPFLLFPQNASRGIVLLFGFIVGLIEDIFTNTPGVCGASLTLVAMIQPKLLKLLSHNEEDEDRLQQLELPSAKSLGWSSFLWYILLISFVFTTLYHLIDIFNVLDTYYLLLNIGGSWLLTTCFLFTFEYFRKGTQRESSEV